MNVRLAFAWLHRHLVAEVEALRPGWGVSDVDAWLAGQPLPSAEAEAAEERRKRSLDHVAEVEARMAAAR